MSDLNNLVSINNAFLANKNMLTDVMDFEPKRHHSTNFLKVMQWLKQSVRIQQCVHQSWVETQLHMNLDVYVLIIKARVTKESCIIIDVQRIKRN